MSGVNDSSVQSLDPGQARYRQAQYNQSKLEQQMANAGISGITRLLNGGIGNIGHTDMPPMPTYQPRFQGGMFSGMLSDPWHQYLAQKEYENRRDRAIANQLDELYLRKLMMNQSQMGFPNGGNSSSGVPGTGAEGTPQITKENFENTIRNAYFNRLIDNAENLNEETIDALTNGLINEYIPHFNQIYGKEGEAYRKAYTDSFKELGASITKQIAANIQKNPSQSNINIVRSAFAAAGVSTDSDVMQSLSKNIADNYHKLSLKKDTSFDQLFGVDITPNAWDKLGQYFLNTVPGANLSQNDKALIYSALQTLTQELGGKTDAEKEAAIKEFLKDASNSTDDIQTMNRNPWWFNNNTNINTIRKGMKNLYKYLPQDRLSQYYDEQNKAIRQRAVYESLNTHGKGIVSDEQMAQLKKRLNQFNDETFIKDSNDIALRRGLDDAANTKVDFRFVAGLEPNYKFNFPRTTQENPQVIKDLKRNLDSVIEKLSPNARKLLQNPLNAKKFVENSVLFTNDPRLDNNDEFKKYYKKVSEKATEYLVDTLQNQNKDFPTDKGWVNKPVAKAILEDVQKNKSGFNGYSNLTANYAIGILGAVEGFSDKIYQDGTDVNSRTALLGLRLDMHNKDLTVKNGDSLIKDGKLTKLGETALKTQTKLMQDMWNRGFGGYHIKGNTAAQDIIKAIGKSGGDYEMEDQEKFNAIMLSIYWRGDGKPKILKNLHDFMVDESQKNPKEPLHKLALRWYSTFARNNPTLRRRYANLKNALGL